MRSPPSAATVMSVVVVVWGAERAKENPAERVGSSEVHEASCCSDRWSLPPPFA